MKLASLSKLERDKGNFDKAVGYFRDAMRYTSEQSSVGSGILSNIMAAEGVLGNIDEAIRSGRMAQRFFSKIGNNEGLATVYWKLGNALIESNHNEAQRLLKYGRRIFIRLGMKKEAERIQSLIH